jgi:hypothetical protein
LPRAWTTAGAKTSWAERHANLTNELLKVCDVGVADVCLNLEETYRYRIQLNRPLRIVRCLDWTYGRLDVPLEGSWMLKQHTRLRNLPRVIRPEHESPQVPLES